MSDELQELQEHAEHARHNPDLAPVSLTMAILAVLVETVSLLGHRAHTEEVVLQNKVSDQWAYFQAKNIRGHEDKLFANLTAIIPASNGEALAKIREERRTTFVLFEIEGLSGEEIARIQSVPLNTVWTRLYHARRDFAALAARFREAQRRMKGDA